MHIEINDNTKLSNIRETFSDYYPYLQIEFFKKPHNIYEASQNNDMIYAGKTIGDIKQTHVSGLIEIRPLNTVAEVEKEFMQRFGLSVQILKKDGNKWEQTTGMDDFTLKQLNELGRSSSDEFIISDDVEGFDEGHI